MNNPSRFWPALALLLLAGACVPGRTVTDPQSAGQVWQNFCARSALAEQTAAPYRINASLRYDTPQKDGHRVIIYLWGNAGPQKQVQYPIRLDVQAGIGVMAARIREDEQLFMAYIPQEEKAYYNPEGSRAMFNFGLPLPFTLADLSLLLNGRYAELFLRRPTAPPFTMPGNISVGASGNLVFKLDPGQFTGSLELDTQGNLVAWREKPGGWLMELEQAEPGSGFDGYGPRRVKFSHPGGYEAIIVLKEREYAGQPFTPEQLELILPPETSLFPLRPH